MSSLTERTTQTISLETAIERTSKWRHFASKRVEGDNVETQDARIPKAVYISRADVEALYHSLNNDETLCGVRAYFTLRSEAAEVERNVVSFCMVPVRDNGTRGGKDVIFLPGTGVGGNTDDSDIYDYTRPCPDYCDIDSPLYGDGDGSK